jgi:hypothetical protein
MSQATTGTQTQGLAHRPDHVPALIAGVLGAVDGLDLADPGLSSEDTDPPAVGEADIAVLIGALHAVNHAMWRLEDRVRSERIGDAEVARLKSAIDALNMRRHSHVQAVDCLLFTAISDGSDAELHSETPGMIVDRLSVLSLRAHYRTLSLRPGDEAALAVLRDVRAQRVDLRFSLETMLSRCRAGLLRFRIYEAHKLYGHHVALPAAIRTETTGGGTA